MAARKNLKKPTKPEPVAVTTICSVCGLPWQDHGKDPTTEDCIRLLKDELASRPITAPQPYPVPSRPFPWYWEEWYNKPYRRSEPYEITYGGRAEKSYSLNEVTPRLLNTTCEATKGPSL
jgi:hypothetical protein